MVETHLTDTLCEFVKDCLKNKQFETQSGIYRPPEVVPGYLPPKRSREQEDFPFVIVRAESGTTTFGQTEASVVFIIGCYSEEIDGYAYCLQVMEHLRFSLATIEDRILDRRYELQFPIVWSNVQEQPYPFWQIQMTTHWVLNAPQLTAVQ